MQSLPESWVIVGSSAEQRGCAELALVLDARGILSRQDRHGAEWLLSVRAEDAELATQELSAYRRENSRAAAALPPPAAVGTGGFGVVSFAAVLVIVAVWVRRFAFGIDWLAVGGMDSGRMLAGQWWRALTALTLHVDVDHLLANVAFGALFTYFVGRYLGGGVGWLAILAAGTLGNASSAWFAGPDHRSIGASTAVFGALGLLTAYTLRRGFPRGTSLRGRIAPLIAGLGLLGYTGTGGPNTDIGAHLMGFVMGFALGLGVAGWAISGAARVQLTAGGVAWLLVAGAWAWGILATA